MRKSAGPTANLENEAEVELKAKENQSNNRISIIATMDNGTMVEAFKYLNYCQLATNGLVSKRYRDLIRTHRNSLALLYVDNISMRAYEIVSAIKIFDQKLSRVAYNEWVIRNGYSKQVPFEDQIGTTQCTQKIFQLSASAYYNGRLARASRASSVFFAQVELNDENWPAFQHFIRLLTDPFIFICTVHLHYQSAFINALSGAVNSDRRLQCSCFYFSLKGNSQKSITWTKNHVRCDKFHILGLWISNDLELNLDEALLDFFVTGAHCTSKFDVEMYDMSKNMVDFVQKFLDLKNSDEYQLVGAIRGNFALLTRDYAEFIVKEEKNRYSTEQIFEFVNKDIGKKLQLSTEKSDGFKPAFCIKIINL
ncbi:hypothetical protein Ddc_24078 [Ditylenchus destructor]|nr:hypothetical protein Ddc_24078 [Ditylenchus destructor]